MSEPIYYYKDKPYKILFESKIKLSSIINSVLKYIMVEDTGIYDEYEWIDIIVYECLYNNPDGKVWAREKNQFFELFKTK